MPFIPAGLPHAIGRGILIAEIQQNCDLTYRVYDYDRIDAGGSKRQLHVKKALDVARPFTDAEIETMRFERGTAPDLLVNCRYFTVKKMDIINEMPLSVRGSFHSLLFLAGHGKIAYGDGSVPFQKGDSFFIPAGMGHYMLQGCGSVLISSI